MTTTATQSSVLTRLPSSLLAAAALTAVSVLLLGYEAVGAQRLGLLNLQAWWPNDQALLTSQVGWHALAGSFDRGLQVLLPGGVFMPGLVILTLVCWLAWGYALLFILRQACHPRLGGDSLAWLGALFVLPAALILLPLLYLQWAPAGQALGHGGFWGFALDLLAAAALIFLSGLLFLPRRIGLAVVFGQALTWGLIYAALMWAVKMASLPTLGPLVMLLVVGLAISLCLILALQRAMAALADFDGLGSGQILEYALMVLAGLAASKDKIPSSAVADLSQVPQDATDEILQRLKEASLARANQGLWAGVWPPERILVAQVASALKIDTALGQDRATPLVQKAQAMGWQGVSLADLIAPAETVVAPQAQAEQKAPEPRQPAQPEPIQEVTPEYAPSQNEATGAGAGHRLVRSPEQSAPRHATPQSRALHLALGRNPGEVAEPPEGFNAQQGIIGAQDYLVLAAGGASWAARGALAPEPELSEPELSEPELSEPEPIEPNDDAVTLDAIRREIQDLMDKE